MIGFFFKIEVEGVENIDSGLKVIVSNHLSYWDGFIIAAALPKEEAFKLTFLAKEKHIEPYGIKFVEKIGIISLSSNSADGLGKVKLAMKKGYCPLIFPEGTRSKVTGRFRHMFAMLANDTDAKVAPIALTRDGRKFTVSFLKCISPSSNSIEEADRVRTMVVDKLDENCFYN